MQDHDFVSRATLELEAAGILADGADEGTRMVGEAVMALARTHAASNLGPIISTVSADLFWKLANGMVLTPLEDTDTDWVETPSGLRHRRCPDLRRAEDGSVWYSRAVVFREPDGSTWAGEAWLDPERTNRVRSEMRVPGFPFTPKTFVFDVETRQVGDNLVESFVAHPMLFDKTVSAMYH
jgi:hypothetical protein